MQANWKVLAAVHGADGVFGFSKLKKQWRVERAASRRPDAVPAQRGDAAATGEAGGRRRAHDAVLLQE